MRRKKWALPAFRGKLFLGWLINVSMLLFSAMLFRAPDAATAWEMTQRVFTWAPGRDVPLAWAGFIAVLASVHALCFWHYHEDLLQRVRWPARTALVSAVVLLIAVFAATGRPFIYFQF